MTESMPIMSSKHLKSMPMAMLDNNQAKKNHGQTLQRLAERGGLAPSEALAIMDGVHWGAYAVCDENDLLLSRRVDRFKAQKP
jgi:hypothetical protein